MEFVLPGKVLSYALFVTNNWTKSSCVFFFVLNYQANQGFCHFHLADQVHPGDFFSPISHAPASKWVKPIINKCLTLHEENHTFPPKIEKSTFTFFSSWNATMDTHCYLLLISELTLSEILRRLECKKPQKVYANITTTIKLRLSGAEGFWRFCVRVWKLARS